MKKPASLRQTLLDCGLNLQPEDLTTLVKKGQIISHYNRPDDRGNEKFQLKYDLALFVMDYSGVPTALAYIVSQWLRENQPGHAPDAIKLELDILNHDSTDVLFTIADLTETITVSSTSDGTLIDSCPPVITDAILNPTGIQALTGISASRQFTSKKLQTPTPEITETVTGSYEVVTPFEAKQDFNYILQE